MSLQQYMLNCSAEVNPCCIRARLNPRWLVVSLMLLMLVVVPVGIAAPISDIAYLDNFSVTRNGTTIFNDTFSEGVTLVSPSSPAGINFSDGTPASYFVRGTIPEQGGRAQLDPANGVITPQPSPPFLPFISEVTATLDTGTNPAGAQTLTAATTFSVAGLFDLTVPSVVYGTYAIYLHDRSQALNNLLGQATHLWVRELSTSPVIQFHNENFATNTATLLGSTPLDPNHQQILLVLSHDTPNTQTITASYAYVDNGIVGSLTTFPNTNTIFNIESFTRPGFEAFDPVPEPASILLLITGLFTLGAFQWVHPRRICPRASH